VSDKPVCPVHGRPYELRRGMANGLFALHCSWDGSLHPDVFMDLIEKPGTFLTPTDKNYKVYIDVADAGEDADELRVVVSGTHEPPAAYADRAIRATKRNRKKWDLGEHTGWFILEPRGPSREDKFYFEHLSDEQKTRFVALLNEGKLSLKYPGHFYRLPFFITRDSAS
jgi:hypothetical protein